MNMRNKILAACALVLLLAAFAYMSFDRIAFFVLSKFYNTDVSYKSITKDPLNGYTFENFRAMNKKMGFGLFSTRAYFKPVGKMDFWKSLEFDFKFKDVHFVKQRTETLKASYGNPEELVAMPFEGRWRYKEINGTIEVYSNGITLKKFSADGNQIRLFISGDIFYNSVIDANVTILFSKDVLKDIPPELHSVIMNEEPKEWKSFSVKLKGNYRSPSVQISGKLFRLNIGTVVVKD